MPPRPDDKEILRWMTEVAVQEHLGIRRLLLVTRDGKRLEVPGSQAGKDAEPRLFGQTKHPTLLGAEQEVENLVEFVHQQLPLFLRARDALVVAAPLPGTGDVLVAEALPNASVIGVLAVALRELAEFFAGHGEPPRLPRHNMN